MVNILLFSFYRNVEGGRKTEDKVPDPLKIPAENQAYTAVSMATMTSGKVNDKVKGHILARETNTAAILQLALPREISLGR